ncbi:type VII secretion target [Kitasatospora sp. CB01950]|uniref:type VII secretion target n=1 Tax=Kitasatospora sp. CB01950 TaxID=1703930 RepID=UPI00093CEF23|nr:type VII secretion target [Kitasatospora sp. CB01950]
MEPDELDGAGQTATVVAERLPDATSRVLGPSDNAEGGLRGWQTGSELDACTTAWKSMLDRLSAELDQQGGKLRQTAANYRNAEQAAGTIVASAGGR